VSHVTAEAYAESAIAQVRDSPGQRLAFLRDLYDVPAAAHRRHLPFRRAALAFMNWQLRRGLLNPIDGPLPGSPWWRAINESLLRDTCEASALAHGHPGTPSTPGVAAHLDFIEHPTASNWYRAHNITIVTGYLANRQAACDEGRVERFFLNVVLMRVLFAHALVAAPRLALSWLAPIGRPLGDPRLGMTGIFLSMSRVLPDRYPVGSDVSPYIAAELPFAHMLDVGVILPRVGRLYEWSADELAQPGLRTLLDGPTPAYAWDPGDEAVWRMQPSTLARAAMRFLPAATSPR